MSPDPFDPEIPEEPAGSLNHLEDLPLRPREPTPLPASVPPPGAGRQRTGRRGALFPEWQPTASDRPPATGEPHLPFPPADDEEAARELPLPVAAGLTPRLLAAFGDGLIALLVAGISYIVAFARKNAEPDLAGTGWALVFALYFSFVQTVVTLALFGRTPGMALAELTARDLAGKLPGFTCAAIRWLASALTAVLLFIPLLTVFFDEGRRTPADRLSGQPLRREASDERLL